MASRATWRIDHQPPMQAAAVSAKTRNRFRTENSMIRSIMACPRPRTGRRWMRSAPGTSPCRSRSRSSGSCRPGWWSSPRRARGPRRRPCRRRGRRRWGPAPQRQTARSWLSESTRKVPETTIRSPAREAGGHLHAVPGAPAGLDGAGLEHSLARLDEDGLAEAGVDDRVDRDGQGVRALDLELHVHVHVGSEPGAWVLDLEPDLHGPGDRVELRRDPAHHRGERVRLRPGPSPSRSSRVGPAARRPRAGRRGSRPSRGWRCGTTRRPCRTSGRG